MVSWQTARQPEQSLQTGLQPLPQQQRQPHLHFTFGEKLYIPAVVQQKPAEVEVIFAQELLTVAAP